MKSTINIISFIVNIALYYFFQILGSFVHFFIFGSGAGADKYAISTPILMVLVQIALIFLLKQKIKVLNGHGKLFNLILYLSPIALFIYHHFIL